MLHLAWPDRAGLSQIERLVGPGRKDLQARQEADGAPHLSDRLCRRRRQLVIRDDIYGFDTRIKTIMPHRRAPRRRVAPPQDPKRRPRHDEEATRRPEPVERREASTRCSSSSGCSARAGIAIRNRPAAAPGLLRFGASSCACRQTAAGRTRPLFPPLSPLTNWSHSGSQSPVKGSVNQSANTDGCPRTALTGTRWLWGVGFYGIRSVSVRASRGDLLWLPSCAPAARQCVSFGIPLGLAG